MQEKGQAATSAIGAFTNSSLWYPLLSSCYQLPLGKTWVINSGSGRNVLPLLSLLTRLWERLLELAVNEFFRMEQNLWVWAGRFWGVRSGMCCPLFINLLAKLRAKSFRTEIQLWSRLGLQHLKIFSCWRDMRYSREYEIFKRKWDFQEKMRFSSPTNDV